jgi:hypothetical protein
MLSFSADLVRTAVALVGMAVLPPLLAAPPAAAQVAGEQEITQGVGGFTGTLEDGDSFGRSVTRLGDLDERDGTTEVAVGAYLDDVDGTTDVGAVWILSLDQNGMVQSQQQITSSIGGFQSTLDAGDEFGVSVDALGDINGNGDEELAVGARLDDDGGGSNSNRGAVWILSLNADGAVSNSRKISDTEGGFGGTLADGDQFGQSVAGGDFDGDRNTELAVGASGTDGGSSGEGAVWILELDGTLSVTGARRIDGNSSMEITLNADDNFGFSVAPVGNLSGDGTEELAVGAFRDDDGGGTDSNRGAIWILSLNADKTVAAAQKISDTAGDFGGTLDDGDRFGATAAEVGDLDGDGVPDLVTGAYLDDDGGSDRGAVWVLYLDADGTVKRLRKISDTEGGFGGALADGDQFGIAAAALDDLDGDGNPDLLAGAFQDPEPTGSSTGPGAAWVLFGEQSLLPVELATFEGVQTDGAVRLRWTTASEQNNAGFRVQRRGPATDAWQRMGRVESAAPEGTTSQAQTYQFTTGTLSAGTHQFRLEQVDLDGTTHLHGPLRVEVGLTKPLRIGGPHPNPVRDRATISFAVQEAAETTVVLYNVLGQKVSTLYRGTPAAGAAKTARLDASTLPNGIYVVRLRAGERTESRRLTVLR